MVAPTIDVPIRTDEDGSIRISGTRVLLEVIIACHQQGDTPEQINEGFPTLKLSDIYAVIAYYLENREAVDAYIRQQDEAGERIRKKIEAEYPEVFSLQNELRERLAKRDE
ncbi:MAG: DUF433 domain-containing protein [Anaerolineae bacterium]